MGVTSLSLSLKALRLFSHASARSEMQKYLASACSSFNSRLLSGKLTVPSRRKLRIMPKCLPDRSIMIQPGKTQPELMAAGLRPELAPATALCPSPDMGGVLVGVSGVKRVLEGSGPSDLNETPGHGEQFLDAIASYIGMIHANDGMAQVFGPEDIPGSDDLGRGLAGVEETHKEVAAPASHGGESAAVARVEVEKVRPVWHRGEHLVQFRETLPNGDFGPRLVPVVFHYGVNPSVGSTQDKERLAHTLAGIQAVQGTQFKPLKGQTGLFGTACQVELLTRLRLELNLGLEIVRRLRDDILELDRARGEIDFNPLKLLQETRLPSFGLEIDLLVVTMGNIQTTILKSAINPDSPGYVPGFHGSGYTSLAIIYTAFSLANWGAPPVVALLGSRATMVVGTIFYALFIAQFYYPNDILLYGSSVLIGLGAAVLWTAQGNFLTVNSDGGTMTRNSGIFWAMLMSSNLIGNTFVYFQFRGLEDIDTHTRGVVTIVLFSICVAGMGVLFLLRKPTWTSEDPHAQDTPTQALKRAWALLWTPNMLLLSITFFYTGLELTFWSGVYGPSIGFTQAFGLQAKSLVGLHGIFIGVGEISGGLLFGIFGHVVVKRGRDPVIILGFLIHALCFFLIFLNIPNSAPSGNVDGALAYIVSNPYLALACSLLLGFGDACFNTQIFSILGSVYADNSAGAFALFKFVQSTAAALAFYYSDIAPLYYQLGFMGVFCVLGTITFLKVELKTRESTAPIPTTEDEAFLGDVIDDSAENLTKNLGLPKYRVAKVEPISVVWDKANCSLLMTMGRWYWLLRQSISWVAMPCRWQSS
eukprot:snap_masked-scaffold249_size238305-processed-gene-0.10 protein:Tk01318 transcript:snap_masked-scaffold249_size238305-processed-gene-0.10-mRNA-1 annotation:"unc93-like protein mfsd11"